MTRLLTGLVAAALLATPAALAAQDSTQAPARMKRNPDLITRMEIDSAGADATTGLDLVKRLRPTWLTTHGPSSGMKGTAPVAVYVNDVRRGGPEALASVPRAEIAEIRHLRGTEATQRFGLDHDNGAILVKLR